MVSVRGFAEAAEHAVGVRVESDVVKMCIQAPHAGEDVYPSNYAQRIVEILQPPFFLASRVQSRSTS